MNHRIFITALGALLLSSCGESPSQPVARAVALRIYPTGGVFNIGESFLFSAVRVRGDSAELGAASTVTWTSSDTMVAVIRSDGSFRARCVGATLITAKALEDSRVLAGQRTVTVASGTVACASFGISEQMPNER